MAQCECCRCARIRRQRRRLITRAASTCPCLRHPVAHVPSQTMQVQTNGDIQPLEALEAAVEDLRAEVDNLVTRFHEGIAQYKRREEYH
jgi:hypothetical protein